MQILYNKKCVLDFCERVQRRPSGGLYMAMVHSRSTHGVYWSSVSVGALRCRPYLSTGGANGSICALCLTNGNIWLIGVCTVEFFKK